MSVGNNGEKWISLLFSGFFLRRMTVKVNKTMRLIVKSVSGRIQKLSDTKKAP